MYLPIIGLLLGAVEILGWLDELRPAVIAAMGRIVLAASVVTYHRNILWSDSWLLWRDSVVPSPGKTRGYSQLSTVAALERRCRQTMPYLELAVRHYADDPHVLLSWAAVLEGLGQKEGAKQKLQRATVVAPDSNTYEPLGLLYGEMGLMSDAKIALDKAVFLGPVF